MVPGSPPGSPGGGRPGCKDSWPPFTGYTGEAAVRRKSTSLRVVGDVLTAVAGRWAPRLRNPCPAGGIYEVNLQPRDVEITVVSFVISYAASVRLLEDAARLMHGLVALTLTVCFTVAGIALDRHINPNRPLRRKRP